MSENTAPDYIYDPEPAIPVVESLLRIFPLTLLIWAGTTYAIQWQYVQHWGIDIADPYLIAGIIAATLVAPLAFVAITWIFIKWDVVEYRVFPTELEKKTGVFSNTVESVEWDEVTDITRSQSAVENRIGMSDLEVQTAGEDEPAIVMHYVRRPKRVHNELKRRNAGGQSSPANHSPQPSQANSTNPDSEHPEHTGEDPHKTSENTLDSEPTPMEPDDGQGKTLREKCIDDEDTW